MRPDEASFLRLPLGCVLCGLSVSACTVGEDFTPPTAELPSQYLTVEDAVPLGRANEHWWLAFEDPALNQLVDIGLAQNLDIRRALQRIEQSEAILRGAGYPVSGVARVAEGKVAGGGDEGRSDTGFVRAEASWLFDLFGELRREREAAGYRLDAAFADADVARLVLLEDLVEAYIDLRFYQELIRLSNRVIESREKTLLATQQLFEEGRATELEVAQAKALVATSRSRLPEGQIEFFNEATRIAALVGRALSDPARDFDRKAPQPVPNTAVVETGVPADLLRNRPDVIKAERQYAEAVALAGVAEADLYPSLQLTGNINVNVSGADIIPAAGFFRIGLDIPVFDLPERQARLDLQLARAAEFRDTWEREVFQSAEEVMSALYALDRHQEAVKATTTSVQAAQEVLKFARKGYAKGDLNFLQILDAERSFLNAEIDLATDIRSVALDFVELNVALGGSYQEQP